MFNDEFWVRLVNFIWLLNNSLPLLGRVVGLFLVIWSLYTLAQKDDRQFGEGGNTGKAAWRFFSGILLIQLNTTFHLVSTVVFVSDGSVLANDYAYVATLSSTDNAHILKALVVTFTTFVGRVTMFRGLYKWATLGEAQQQGGFMNGATLLIIGMLLANFRLLINLKL